MTNNWRKAFPIFSETMQGKKLAFLDSGASAQKPQCVIDAMSALMHTRYANIHRGLYDFSAHTTALYEGARATVAKFIKAKASEIVFTRNATEGINLVAQSWGAANLSADDEIILTVMEHHANLVPWHILQSRIGFTIKYIPITPDGTLDLQALDELLTNKTKLVAFTHISNVLGTINPAAGIVARIKAHNSKIKVLIDAAQSAVHMPLDVVRLGADFLTMTGHKLYGPTGIGVLWGRAELLADMPPYQGGGDMIADVTLEGSIYLDAPQRFEAGTPAFVEAIGLAAAIDFVNEIGWSAIQEHEAALAKDLYARLSAQKHIHIAGNAPNRAGIFAFTMDGAPPSDIGMILDRCGVAVRVGHHCAQPLHKHLGLDGTVRASLALYNNTDDLDALMEALAKAKRMLA